MAMILQKHKAGNFGSVHTNPDGRDAGPLLAAQGGASEVYRVYMSECRRSDAGKGPSPEGLPLGGRHPAARTLAIARAMARGTHLVWQPPKGNAIRLG